MIIDKFGIVAIRNAWFDANQVNDHVLQGYTKVSFLIEKSVGLNFEERLGKIGVFIWNKFYCAAIES